MCSFYVINHNSRVSDRSDASPACVECWCRAARYRRECFEASRDSGSKTHPFRTGVHDAVALTPRCSGRNHRPVDKTDIYLQVLACGGKILETQNLFGLMLLQGYLGTKKSDYSIPAPTHRHRHLQHLTPTTGPATWSSLKSIRNMM
ncbi:hypothetical protein HRR88_001248 [Exophiala dermatitidis]|nr:hypothetical protein HRR84_006624 [Exophiala dermatitidis]KAJ4631701.1 hypothetical protein HRR88_001248 [Exophiala dermatitidis]KAJ4639382.1 hypothetical protein HRR89_004700 [Exophiala dermatitidis]KAJ4654313.1 hypothetical protein HRR91_003805 [Exophiala dermatitidis]KAJ4666539.1 hypothetical protein HRR92_007608 [Exophiala dermatitidis]